MKKLSLVAATLLFSIPGISAATPDQLLMALSGGHARAFGAENLFSKPLDLDVWNHTINEVKAFVTEKSKDLVGRKDSTLMKALADIEEANMLLINTMKIIRGIFNTANEEVLQRELPPLTKVREMMENLSKTLNNAKFTLDKKKQARDILIKTALFIETTASRARKEVIMKTYKGNTDEAKSPSQPNTDPAPKPYPTPSKPKWMVR